MNRTAANTPSDIDNLINRSAEIPAVLLKHSTRCGISSVVLDRFARQWDQSEHPDAEFMIIDVIANRDVSNYVAEKLDIRHESPQLILLWKGRVVYHTSHMGINFADLSREIHALPA